MRLKRFILIVILVFLTTLVIRILDVFVGKLVDQKVVQKLHNSIPSVVGVSPELSPNIQFCKNITTKPNNIVYNNNYWQQVIDKNIYLYSAYYDERYHLNGVSYHFIRVLGTVKNKTLIQKLYCYLWCNNAKSPLIVSVISKEIWADFWSKDLIQKLYKTHLFSCPVPQQYKHNVIAISITNHECIKPLNYLKIRQKQIKYEEERQPKDFAVCVKAMDFHRDISMRLIEWIELQLLLGADIISFYVYYVTKSIQKVLQYYEKKSQIKVKYISIPGTGPNVPLNRSQYLRDNIWQKRRLELIPLNDCLYDHLYSHRFVVLLDLDEAIVPTHHKHWTQMMDYITRLKPDALLHYTSFSVQNAYFFGDVNNRFLQNVSNNQLSKDLVILRHVYRSANFSAPGFAVKSFVSTATSLTVSNHFTLDPLYHNMTPNTMISRSVAQLNHYRDVCPNTMADECSDNFMKYFTIDTIVWKFKNLLIQKILNTSQLIGH